MSNENNYNNGGNGYRNPYSNNNGRGYQNPYSNNGGKGYQNPYSNGNNGAQKGNYTYQYTYPNNGQYRSNPNRKQNNEGESDWLSWAVIAALIFGGAWFIGVPLLLIKLFKTDKQDGEKSAPSLNAERMRAEQWAAQQRAEAERQAAAQSNAKMKSTVSNFSKTPTVSKGGSLAMILVGTLVLLAGMAATVNAVDGSSLLGVLWGLGIMMGSGAMMGFGFGRLKAEQRYPRYVAIIGANQAVEIKSLAKKIGVKEKTARRDLQTMVDRGIFGKNAYINDELGFLFVSSEADDELQAARARAEEKTRQAQAQQKKQAAADEVDAYEKLLFQIRDVNDRIAQPEMTEKIYRLEEITRQIFRTVQESPEKRKKIDKFMTYYLPTTLKLLESYARLEKTGVEGDNISQSRETIEAAMDNIVTGFKNQLDELYKTDVLDIETEIDVMTKLMGRENPESEFKQVKDAKKAEQQPADNRTQFQKDFGLESAMGDTYGTTQTGSGTASAGGSAVQYK